MNVQNHTSDTIPGALGTALAGGFTFMGFIGRAIPILQALSLLAGIAVALITFVYYQRKIREHDVIERAKIAAAEVKATAVVTATALDEATK